MNTKNDGGVITVFIAAVVSAVVAVVTVVAVITVFCYRQQKMKERRKMLPNRVLHKIGVKRKCG